MNQASETPLPGVTNSFGEALPPAVKRRRLPDALHTRDVVGDEINEDPPAVSKPLRLALEQFVAAIRAVNVLRAERVLLSILGDEELVSEAMCIACREAGFDP